jgi:hypothetical protein
VHGGGVRSPARVCGGGGRILAHVHGGGDVRRSCDDDFL